MTSTEVEALVVHRRSPVDAFGDSIRSSATVEAFRMLALSVDTLLAQASLWSVAVISPRPGDGRSATAEGLARGLAELRPPTRLLACDPFDGPRRRRRSRGAVDHRGDIDLTTPAFDVLDIGGQAAANPAAFIERTRAVVKGEISRGHSVVIDTPPASSSNLAFALAQVAGAALYVGRSRGNHSDLHASVRSQLDLLGIPLLGVVVTES